MIISKKILQKWRENIQDRTQERDIIMRDTSLVLDKQIAKEFHKRAERTKEYPLDVGEMKNISVGEPTSQEIEQRL